MTEIKFNAEGLVPVVVQDAYTNEVLMLGFMNREAFEKTEREKLVTREERREAGRARNVYSITPKGRAELHRWLQEPAAVPPPRHELLLKLFFGDYLPAAHWEKVLLAQKEAASAELREYRAIEEKAAAGASACAAPDPLTVWYCRLAFSAAFFASSSFVCASSSWLSVTTLVSRRVLVRSNALWAMSRFNRAVSIPIFAWAAWSETPAPCASAIFSWALSSLVSICTRSCPAFTRLPTSPFTVVAWPAILA